MRACPCLHRRPSTIAGVVLLVLGISIILSVAAGALTPEEKKKAAKEARWKVAYDNQIPDAALQPYIEKLESFGSRVAGYPGNAKAADYIADQFEKIGLDDVSQQVDPKKFGPKRPYMEEFNVAVPIVEKANLQVEGETTTKTLRLYPLWPNVVRTSKLPRGGIDAPLMYAGKGSLIEFNGQNVKNSVVLMDFDTGGNWLNAPRLGAQAVIFIEPRAVGSGVERGEAENKFLKIPIDIPRFWIRRQDAWPLLARLKSQSKVKVHLECDMEWKTRPSWNIIGEIKGTSPKKAIRDQVVYIESYYDSMSIVPELAPGAEAAAGVASMLEIAKFFKANPPARTVRFLSTGAHFISLGGIRSYLSQHIKDLTDGHPVGTYKWLGFWPRTKMQKQNINLFCALDLSSQRSQVGIFYKGMYYNYSDAVSQNFADLARVSSENAAAIAAIYPEAAGGFADGVNPTSGKPWSTYIMGKMALDSEPVTLGGSRGVGFFTTDDARNLVATPFDRSEEINYVNLGKQTRLLLALFQEILHDPDMPVDEKPAFSRMTLNGGFALLSGRSLKFNFLKDMLPNEPVPGTMAILRTDNSTLMGVRSDQVVMTDENGAFEFDGIPTMNAYGWRKTTWIESYHLDPNTGAINFAPEMGAQGGKAYPTNFVITRGETNCTVVIFPCYSVALYDLVDPQTLTTLKTITVLNGETDSEPQSYGFTVPHPEPWMSHVEDVALVFARRPDTDLVQIGGKKGKASETNSRIKLMFSISSSAIRGLLLNADTINNKDPEGLGYLISGSTSLENTPLKVAKDMWKLDEMRINKLARFNIVNQNVKNLHEDAAAQIRRAEKALKEHDYVNLSAYARAAWGYESRAYPEVQATNDDVVKGVIFYLFLMLPFIYFMERLIIAAPDLKGQITGMAVIFAVVVLIFSQLHPAFKISSNPYIVPLAFVMLALSVMVIALVVMKFEAQLRALQQSMGGVHRADIGRLGVAAAAFGLGISNMRKRKARTIFTCITLVALTFTVLSFTSVSTSTQLNVRPTPGIPRYQGIMVRNADWSPLEDSAFRVLNDEFGTTRAVAPRVWFFTSKTDEQSFVTITSNKSNKPFNSRALVGLTPQETRVTGLNKALLKGGRWFRPGDKNVVILPTAIADSFDITDKDVGRAKIYLGGIPFNLIGVLNSSLAKSIVDLDQEQLSPVDFIQMARMQARRGSGGNDSQSAGFQQYIHLAPDMVAFVPYDTALNLGGQVQSVGVEFATPAEVKKTLNQLVPRLGFNLYAGQDKNIFKYSSLAKTSMSGLQDLAIPILIAALIVLNTMLGSVYERIKEIHIYSSLGLAPNHIGTLFLAEAFVYAVLGAIFGYLLGQTVALVLVHFNLATGLNLNYSSVSAVASTALVIATVMLSTVYPSRKASEVATPAVERRWSLPAPVGDKLEVTLPFAVTGKQANALNAFLIEWFNAYGEYSTGDFVTENVEMLEEDGEYGKGYLIRLMTWLAPFDLGVSQRTELRTVPTDMEDVYEIKLTLYRESGDVPSWARVNRKFLDTMRKQFLIWRTLSAGDRDRYLGMSDAQAEPSPA